MGLAILAEGDGLVPAVPAGNVAAAATDAGVPVNDREHDRRAVQVRGADKIGKLFAYQILHAGNAPGGHIVLQSVDQVVNNPVAVLHHGRAYLHVLAP